MDEKLYFQEILFAGNLLQRNCEIASSEITR